MIYPNFNYVRNTQIFTSRQNMAYSWLFLLCLHFKLVLILFSTSKFFFFVFYCINLWHPVQCVKCWRRLLWDAAIRCSIASREWMMAYVHFRGHIQSSLFCYYHPYKWPYRSLLLVGYQLYGELTDPIMNPKQTDSVILTIGWSITWVHF